MFLCAREGCFVQNIQFLCSGIGELPAVSVTEDAGLEMESCTVQSGTALGVSAKGSASVKATATAFVVPNGTGLRLTEHAKAPAHAMFVSRYQNRRERLERVDCGTACLRV